MSATLHQWLDPAHLQSMLAANEPPKLQAFRILIGPKGSPRLNFTAMARSSGEAFVQHFDLSEIGERCEVLTAEEAGRS